MAYGLFGATARRQAGLLDRPADAGDGTGSPHRLPRAPTGPRCGLLRRRGRAGAEVLHEPRVWPEYHAHYYGAFVRDPDGNNVEAVCHCGLT